MSEKILCTPFSGLQKEHIKIGRKNKAMVGVTLCYGYM